MPLDKKCWGNYGTLLRKRMFQERRFNITVSIEDIRIESSTRVTVSGLGKPGFWEPIREVKSGWDLLFKQGVLADFCATDGKVTEVTFSLEKSRRQHLERLIESQGSSV